MCYRPENTLFGRRVRASFSPGNFTVWGSEGVNDSYYSEGGMIRSEERTTTEYSVCEWVLNLSAHPLRGCSFYSEAAIRNA